jgi:hypothetical protein
MEELVDVRIEETIAFCDKTRRDEDSLRGFCPAPNCPVSIVRTGRKLSSVQSCFLSVRDHYAICPDRKEHFGRLRSRYLEDMEREMRNPKRAETTMPPPALAPLISVTPSPIDQAPLSIDQAPPLIPEEWTTIRSAATTVNRPFRTISGWYHTGKVKGAKVGSTIYVDPKDVEQASKHSPQRPRPSRYKNPSAPAQASPAPSMPAPMPSAPAPAPSDLVAMIRQLENALRLREDIDSVIIRKDGSKLIKIEIQRREETI